MRATIVNGTGTTSVTDVTNATFMNTNITTSPVLPASTNALGLITDVENCQTNFAGQLNCSGLGTLTIDFIDAAGNPVPVRNPRLHLSRVAGRYDNSSNQTLWFGVALTLNTAGITLGTPSHASLAVSGNTIRHGALTSSTTTSCAASATTSAGCGTVPLTGTTSQLVFDIGASRSATVNPWNLNSSAGVEDAYYITVTFDEDFGDAPASFDTPGTAAASHLIGDMKLGAGVTAENPATFNTGTIEPSPIADATASGDGNDDGAAFGNIDPTAGTIYSQTVALSGASRSGQVCGWIDFNKNNVFDNPAERACSAVFASGTTSTSLSWTVPAGVTAGTTFARLRTSYDTTGVQSPLGLLSSGEVEDYAVTLAVPLVAISGTVFQDTATNLLADGAVGGANNPGIPSVTVRLFNSAGTQLSTTTTNASGAYSFTGLTGSSTYYVTVDAPMRTASGTTGVLQEQTYASAGIGNAGTAGGSSGYGPLCVESGGSLSAPTYTNSDAGNPLTGTASSHSNGYCFGGRRGAVADAGGTTLASNEHLTRVVLGASNVTAVDYGFSYDVVTNTNATGQGGIVQFVNNANLASGTDAMRVVPAVAPNASGGSGTWWETSLSALYGTSALPAFTSTILMEGTPYSNADGTTPTTTNPGDMVATSTAVGNQGDTLGSIPRPDFAINWVGATAAEYLIQMNTAGAANSVISNMALYGTGAATANSAMIGYNTGPITVTRNVLGAKPDGTAVAGSPRFVDGIRTDSTNGAAQTNTYNYITGMLTYGIDLRSANPSDQVNGYVTAHNYLIGNGTGITVVNANGYHAVINNYITGSTLNGVITSLSASFNNITENTATGNGGAGIRVDGPNNNILYNVTTSNSRGGIATQGATAQQVLISQNTFGNNTLNAIDLGNNGVTTATATGANCPSSGTTNASLPRGNITAASLSGTTVTMSGTYCNTGTYTIEVYKVGGAAVGDGTPQAGEGVQYLGSLTGFSGGTFTSQSFTLVSGATLAVGDQISFITIRTDGSSAAGGTAGHTSEFSPNFTLNPLADLSVTKTNTPGVNGDVDQANDTVTRGSTVNYTIVVSNAGPATANGAVLRDPAPSGMTCTVVSCAVTSGGAVCPSVTVAALQSPGGVIIATLPANSSLTFTLTCTVQ